ncbi:hypothetical protein Dip510_000515 [Elusimicrobium posterum]|uniref:hypothetical protein n=1 Tax=Elusimicrobium posterum TaxID=3116653 RepID=UPI003C712049
MSFLQTNLLALFNNQSTLVKDIVEKRSFTLGFLGYLAGAFAVTFFGNLTTGCTVTSFIAQMIVSLVFFMPFCFFLAAVTHVFLDIFAKSGNALGLFSIIGISEFAKLLLVALGLIGMGINGGKAFMSLSYMAVVILQFFFLLGLLSKAYETSKSMVFVAFIFTMALAGVMLLILLMLPFILIISAVA